jgi:hypothetical protein
MNRLRPTDEQMRAFALRETDPKLARSFEPIVAGPIVAVVLLGVAGALGAICAPFVLVARLLRRER